MCVCVCVCVCARVRVRVRVRVFISFISPLVLFLYLSPQYLSFPLRIDPLCFQAGCRKKRLNLALVLCVCIVVHFF